MEIIYAGDTNHVTIICPKCGSEKKIEVTNFKDTNIKLKAGFLCGEVFRFTLDFRKHYRKNVRFPGEYIFQGKDERGEVIIDNISAGGIRFVSQKPPNFSVDDTVELKFTLDDPTRTKIQELVKIIWVMYRNVGAQ